LQLLDGFLQYSDLVLQHQNQRTVLGMA
jgi:hypothetical protein